MGSHSSEGVKTFTEYGIFEDAHFWEPLFESGELPEHMRTLVDEPKQAGLSLWHAYKAAELANAERQQDPTKVDKYGLLIVKSRTVTETEWVQVTPAEIEAVRRT